MDSSTGFLSKFWVAQFISKAPQKGVRRNTYIGRECVGREDEVVGSAFNSRSVTSEALRH